MLLQDLKFKFNVTDTFYIAMMLLPIAFAIVLNVLTEPVSTDITITGARIFFTIPMPFQGFPVTESQINSALVLISLFFFCRFITHGISEKAELKRQFFAELLIERLDNMVIENMGHYFEGYTPFIIAVLLLSAFSSLLSLFGIFPPTADINIVGGWAILVFFIITYYKMKGGPLNYLKSFTKPVAFLAPINFISEFATPVSMSFRHYGNILSGTVISTLLAFALGRLSNKLLGTLPGFLANIPIFQVGIPAVLSIYFDVFSGCLQAFIFAMLTMLGISGAFDIELYKKRKQKKLSKQ